MLGEEDPQGTLLGARSFESARPLVRLTWSWKGRGGDTAQEVLVPGDFRTQKLQRREEIFH